MTNGKRRISVGSFAAKVDGNQKEIISALTEVATVVTMSTVGRGFPDLVVYCRGRWYLLEVKAKGGRLTPAQEIFHSCFPAGAISVVTTPKEALQAIGYQVGDA